MRAGPQARQGARPAKQLVDAIFDTSFRRRITSPLMSLSALIPPPFILPAILEKRRLRMGFRGIYRKYRAYTVIRETMYLDNLEL